jgi:hypothetical protein
MNTLIKINFMKELKGFMLLILTISCLFYSCIGNNIASVSKDNSASSSTGNSFATSTGDASFSCKIDGKDFSGKGTDEFGNAAYATVPGIINFVLMPIVAGQNGVPAQLAFHVADNPDYSVRYSESNSIDNDYQCKEITVTITSSGTSRVTGTFSGTLIAPKTDRDVPVTDGKFDIPYSSYSKK